jgi:integrase
MARLPKGVYRLKDGRLRKRFTMDKKAHDVYGKTLKELEEKEYKKRKELESRVYCKNTNITLDKYFDEWIAEREKHTKGNTIRSYVSTYNVHISPTFGKNKIKDIEKREIKQFLQAKHNNGESTTTVNRALLVFSMVLKDCVNDEIITVNPAEGLKKFQVDNPKASETKHRALTEEEQILFMQELKHEYYYEFVAFMLCTGMRCSEVSALTWDNVDQINRVIHVKATATKTKDGKQTIGKPKTKSGERDIPITAETMDILRKAQEKNIIINGKALAFNTLVFFSSKGEMVQIQNVNNAISRTVKRLQGKGYQFEPITSHAMRDTFATRFIEQGQSPQTLKAILGHSSLAMTMDLYAHVLPNTKSDAMNKVKIIV